VTFPATTGNAQSAEAFEKFSHEGINYNRGVLDKTIATRNLQSLISALHDDRFMQWFFSLNSLN
jgi:hypothetical protein